MAVIGGHVKAGLDAARILVMAGGATRKRAAEKIRLPPDRRYDLPENRIKSAP